MERGRVGSNSSGVSAGEGSEFEGLFVEKDGGARCGWAA
jgi:hypothetical protein